VANSLTHRPFYVICIGLLQVPVILMKELGEFPIVSYFVTVSVLAFIFITGIDLMTNDIESYAVSDFVQPIWGF
jgi:hypothetical protein